MTKRVLVVDDDPVMLAMTQFGLENDGYVVSACEKSRDALRLLSDSKFDALVTDLIMPEMDGLELIREVRRAGHDLVVIAMSTDSLNLGMSVLPYAKAFGADETLTKPASPKSLVFAIEHARQNRLAPPAAPHAGQVLR